MDSNQLHQALDSEENCKHISAAELRISSGGNPSCWEMVPDRSSIMFPKNIARLKSVCWFDVIGPDLVRTSGLPTQVEQFNLPTIRVVENDWIEYKVGEFAVEEAKEKCLQKSAMLATSGIWKSSLSLDGIFIRPKGFRVLIKLIDVEMSLAFYHGDTLEIHTQSFSRNVDNYSIISYVWSLEDDFAVDEKARGEADVGPTSHFGSGVLEDKFLFVCVKRSHL